MSQHPLHQSVASLGLVNFPNNVRHNIYRHLIPTDTYLFIDRKAWRKYGYEKHRPCVTKDGHDDDRIFSAVALFFVCRQLKFETVRLLYSSNTIVTNHTLPLRRLSPITFGAITSLKIRLVSGPRLRRLATRWMFIFTRLSMNADRICLSGDDVHLELVYEYESRHTREVEQVDVVKTLMTSLVYGRPISSRVQLQLEDRRLVRLSQDDGQQATGQVGFRFCDLPEEIRRKILKYTDLITPHNQVLWSPRGYFPVMGPGDNPYMEGYNPYMEGYNPYMEGYNPYMEGYNRRHGCQWLSEDRSFKCEGYYNPAEPLFPYWEKPTAYFLVSRAFHLEAKAVFLEYNHFEIPEIRGQSYGGSSVALRFFSKFPPGTLRSLRVLEIKHPLIFYYKHRAGGLYRDELWGEIINARLRESSFNLELLSFTVRLRGFRKKVREILQPGIMDTLRHMSKMVNRYFWPLVSVGRRPGVQTLTIEITSACFYGHYYLRRPSDELPLKLRRLEKAEELHLARLVKIMPNGDASEITDALVMEKDQPIEIRNDIKNSEVYKDAWVEGLWWELRSA